MPSLPDGVRHLAPQHRHPELLVGPTFEAGDWRSLGVDCPFVFRAGGRLGMTVVGWDGRGYQSGLAWSDGERWTEPDLIFGRVPGSAHRRHNAAITSLARDTELLGQGALVRIDGWYYGTYHAYPDAGYEAGSAVIGFVRSRDLVTWEETGGLLRPEDGAAWERGGLYKSWLMRHEGRWWLFYNAKDKAEGAWVEQTGAAISDDLVTWERVSSEPLLPVGPPGSFDERFASDPCVLQAPDGTWVMFYFGLAPRRGAVDLVATSPDLLTWTRDPEPLLKPGPAGSVDDLHAHKPSVIRDGDRLLHFYCAVRRLNEPVTVGEHATGEHRGIGLAWSEVPR
ncbi:hypothetical protein LQF12_15420 [Ruania suaedae]|uniref:hypothetical protein n=1 Tax=Ruania suaedae TaxID=2897774 RepID=UPI001E5D9D34|nr:hypothetical protein [Ruania suaedae]UFU02854.1 hypothetical protein LQF12_15420 [Ruania suaedae]